MFAGHAKLHNLIAIVDRNRLGATDYTENYNSMEPLAERFRAFGWEAVEIDGNDMQAIVTALANARQRNGKPKAIVLRTTPGKGVPTLERRERAHFVRVANDEWDALKAELETHHG